MENTGSFALRPRARIMRTLGNELISNDTVAVIELVKNAYDADAKRVLIRFLAPLEQGEGVVEVIDNGVGMTLETVRKAWMEPATPSKRRESKSKKLDRRMLGEKGIGRFATMRLSEVLELITLSSESEKEVYGYFDWSQFDDPEKYLDEVLLLTEERIPNEICSEGFIEKLQWDKGNLVDEEDFVSGTVLRMNKLKHSWGIDEFQDLQRGLARLISPFFQNENFLIKLEAPEEFSQFSEQISPPTLVAHPHYSVEGTIDSSGKCALTLNVHAGDIKRPFNGGFVRTDKMRLQHVDDETFKKQQIVITKTNLDIELGEIDKNSLKAEQIFPHPECGPLNIELRIWDRNDLGNLEQVTQSNLKDIRKDLDAIAGINIYRDGFRVLPYGEPNNDWLRLDIRRVQKPAVRLSNNQIVGYVAISADGNPNLVDQSNRQGLDENLGYSDLKEIMLTILNEIENLRKSERKGGGDDNGTESPTRSLFAPLDFGDIRAHFAAVYPTDKRADELISVVEKSFSKQLENIKSVVSRYHSLATLGQLIDTLLHDGRHPLAKIATESVLGIEDIEEAGLHTNSIFSVLHKRYFIIKNQADVLKTAFRRIEPFGGRKKGRPSQLYLEKIIENAFEVFSTEINEKGIATELPESLTLVRLDESEFQEVMINLIQNSIYWLQFTPKKDRRIAVTVSRLAPDCVEVTFADSGPGIPDEIGATIFEPYFSTKPDGIGLGLAIAGEIITDYYGGKLELMDNKKLGGAAFKITLRKRV